MAYVKITDYAAKDALLSGNPLKAIKGLDVGADFDAVAAASVVTDAAINAKVSLSGVETITGAKTMTGANAFNGTVGATTPTTGAFTSLAYSTTLTGGTGIVNLGSGQFYKDASGNVGIGSTESYGSLLSVSRAQSSLVADLLTLRDASAGVTFNLQTYLDPVYGTANLFNYNGSYLAFRSSGTEAMRINSSGNVGIGTSSPATKLHVNTGAAGYGITVAASSQTSNTYQFGIDSSSNLAIYDTNAAAQRLVLSPAGNLGLGVTPSAWNSIIKPLELNNGVYFAAQTDGVPVLYIGANNYYGTGSFRYKVSSSPAAYYQQNAGIHSWYTAPSGTAGAAISFTQAMTLDASGNLMVGTTSASGARLAILGNGGSIGASFNPNSSTAAAMEIIVGSNNTTQYALYVYSTSNSNFNLQIFSNGNVQNRNNSYGAISDAKLKENVVDATPKLDKLNQVRVVNFNLIGEEQKQLGVIAQELEQIFPGMVDESPDRDKEGNDLGTTTKSVKYSVFVPMLIKAMQEQQAQIASLTARLDAANL